MHVHLIAVAGTGMGSLAGLLKAAGHQVSGSDVAFYPPMGPALKRWGIELMEGFDPKHLDQPRPDLVVVGNVCRPDNVEARAAIDGGLKVTSIVGALRDHILTGTAPLVVGGTHGKTTTSAMCAWLLDQSDAEPGFLIGGLPHDFEQSFRLPATQGTTPTGPNGPAPGPMGRRPPFVIEGDEYDTAFFEKTPKFWHYRPEVAIITSIEHDHIDIYPDEASYRAAFVGFIERVPADGLIVAHGADPLVVELVSNHAIAPIAWYGLEGDDWHGMSPHWLAAPAGTDGPEQAFDVFVEGSQVGRATLPLTGDHNLRNALAACAATSQGFGVPARQALAALGTFGGVARRQDLLAEVGGVRIIDDFAHHPTAVRETLRGLRARYPEGALWAVYEPRSATACRSLHQQAYLEAFNAADRVVFPPLGRDNIPEVERLDLEALAEGLAEQGVRTDRAESIDAIIALLSEQTRPGDTVVLLSNGAFGGIGVKLPKALAQ
ncbi:MAG: UDP-N-acetylmuramate:L-alanyl-gamma-D-glutamyl-meso-diaminopimelate ligase [Deltaproteobacteria bacterium]|nr:MAG: UDP-N-acetylmuramate:L-alanyl-gamma-D-glutamyl-meso-diaminopimelate ligase [Deltaproteobacteria bacterium]